MARNKTAKTTSPLQPDMIYAEVVVVTCGCGFYPLENAMHRTSQDAWNAAAAHVALNPTKCQPRMNRDMVPAVLAPKVSTSQVFAGESFATL